MASNEYALASDAREAAAASDMSQRAFQISQFINNLRPSPAAAADSEVAGAPVSDRGGARAMARVAFTRWDAGAVALAGAAYVYAVHGARAEGRAAMAGAAPAPARACAAATRLLQRAHVEALERDGYVVIPHAITAAQLQVFAAVPSCVWGRRGSHTAAAAAQAAQAAVSDLPLEPTGQARSTRRDSVLWVGDSSLDAPALTECCELLRGVASAVEAVRAGPRGGPSNERLTVPARLQLAKYGAGGFYSAHRDNGLGPAQTILDTGLLGWLRSFASRRRAVTAILYLNSPTWDCATQGGALRVYPCATDECSGGAATDASDNDGDGNSARMRGAGAAVDIAPTGGTLVLFNSRTVLHQVVPVVGSGQRYALTAWIWGEPELLFGRWFADSHDDV